VSRKSARQPYCTHFGRHCFGARRSKTNRPQRIAAV
jgi:hypothetical protein